MSEKTNISERYVIRLENTTTFEVEEKTEANAHLPSDELRQGVQFQFKGAVDEQVIENRYSQLEDGNMIHTSGNNWYGNHQVWIAYLDEDHFPPWGFRLQTKDSDNESFVMSALNNFQNHRVVLERFNGKKEQFWHLTKDQLINAKTGKALSNYGTGVNLRTINADVNDLHQRWIVYVLK